MLSAEIINYTNLQRKVCCRLNPFILLGFTVCIILLVIFSFHVGGQYYAQHHAKYHTNDYLIALQMQNNDIKLAKQDAEKSLQILTTRLGQLEHQVMSLNALGKQLSKTNKLQELDFPISETNPDTTQIAHKQIRSVSDFVVKLDQLGHKIETNNDALKAMHSIMLQKSIADNNHPSIMPIKAYVSSWFGWRADPLKKHNRRSFHEGIDFSAEIGTAIKSVAAGIVSWSGPKDNYGNLIEIDHGNGYITRYGHINELFVKVGDKVDKGQLIASVGNTGRSTGPHLHFEIEKDGQYQDPKHYMKLN